MKKRFGKSSKGLRLSWRTLAAQAPWALVVAMLSGAVVPSSVIRARKIVIEDENGKDRIIIAALGGPEALAGIIFPGEGKMEEGMISLQSNGVGAELTLFGQKSFVRIQQPRRENGKIQIGSLDDKMQSIMSLGTAGGNMAVLGKSGTAAMMVLPSAPMVSVGDVRGKPSLALTADGVVRGE